MASQDDYAEFFLASRADTIQYDTLELSHPNFTRIYRMVRNKTTDLTATLENELGEATFEYVPMTVRGTVVRDNLDYGVTVVLGDLGETLTKELTAVGQADGFATRVSVVYRTYRSDDLSAPLFGPVPLEISDFNFNGDGASFTAHVPKLNETTTGESYDIDRFETLRGVL